MLTGSGIASRNQVAAVEDPPPVRRWNGCSWPQFSLAVVRARGLSEDPLWVDEAESSINALTILQHGVPTDNYLGLPIFENTYTLSWPESAEYEFKDSSYSSRGLAIYHGWLPLYSIAASFSLNGVRPDEPDGDLRVRHTLGEMRHRTRAARVPAVLFGVAFLVGIFFAARELYGVDAAWAVLGAGALNTSAFAFDRQSRYYSSSLVLYLLAALMFFHAEAGPVQDFVIGHSVLSDCFIPTTLRL
jgi:hypothetical protein